jgi:hypothetical protein
MGRYDSSKTRVAPLFDLLLRRDVSGASWLDPLLSLGSRRDIVARAPRNQRLVAGHGRRWGDEEVSLDAPLSLLEHLVQNIDSSLLDASSGAGEARVRRAALAQCDPATVADALRRLRAGERGRHWFVLEGESRPDALLETPDLVVCIEGKRTETGCTTHTSWMRRRSQLVRHMDAAVERFPTKTVLGLLIVEGPGKAEATQPSPHWIAECATQYESSMIHDSLPHRSADGRARIAGGILGVTTWQASCAATGVDWASLPNAV